MEFDRFVSEGMYYTYMNGLDLDENSVIFDLGTYLGHSSIHFSNMYKSKIFTFEPFDRFFSQAKVNLTDYNNVNMFPFGLGNKNTHIMLSDDGDATSAVRSPNISENSKKCEIKDFFEFIQEHQISNIDLLYVNIEGGEYDLLDYIYSKNFQLNIKYIIVQYHYPDPMHDRIIQNHYNILSSSHKCVFDYKYIWTKWVNLTQIPYEGQCALPPTPEPIVLRHTESSYAQTESVPHTTHSGKYSLSDSLRQAFRNSYRTQ